MKRIKLTQNYNAEAAVSTGYLVEVARQRDGDYMLVLTGHSRWQGTVTDDVWQIRDFSTIEEASDGGLDEAFMQAFDSAKYHLYTRINGHEMVKVQSGYVVQ